ncbi:unnamed protein product [Rotaria sordida]|uniref:Sodium-coupled monocarboxylate transporter 1 n=2 Tax=Rotaria sordida TaxID=392033 RepID=A0A815K7R9_9BILA|nr:unnamed protein product [Rotaria sordida]CAF1450741.1 unnamed protein product [Rotaria sordida]
MGVFPAALSITASFLSANTMLGTPSEIYTYGTMYCYHAVSWTIAVTITALVFMPKFREMNCTSAYEYLEKRFDCSVRVCVSLIFSIFMLIYMAIVLYGPALALSQTTGLNIWLSVVSIGVVCTFYSSVGGMKAVIWTDVLQALVMFVGLLSAIIQGLIVLGGFGPTFSIASKNGRIQFDSIDPRVRHTVWSVLIGSTFNALSTYGFNQTQIQRYMCVRTTRGAAQALFINAVGSAFIILSSCLIGIIIYAYYADCDPYTAKFISAIDQIFPYFVMEVLSNIPGLPGVFLACIFSGSLSTISSGLNSLTAVIIEDVYKGAVVMLLTYVVSHLGPILNASTSLFGALQGPIMGVFFLGFFFPRANHRGGLVGFVSGVALPLWIFVGSQVTKNQRKSERLPLFTTNCALSINETRTFPTSPRTDPLLDLYSVSYMWYSPIAVSTVLIVGLIVSYLTRPLKPHEVDPKLIIPIDDVCCCCLPKSVRHWLRCDIKENKMDYNTLLKYIYNEEHIISKVKSYDEAMNIELQWPWCNLIVINNQIFLPYKIISSQNIDRLLQPMSNKTAS